MTDSSDMVYSATLVASSNLIWSNLILASSTAAASSHPALLADAFADYFALLDELVQHAMDRNSRFASIVWLHELVERSNPSTWSTLIPLAADPACNYAKQYDSSVKWAIGAMSVGLTREEKTVLAQRLPCSFGKEGTSSKWA